ncbi:MAG: glutathione S-transferase family protein [Myxococcota bacterium]
MIELFDKPECPFCYRVRLCLGALELAYERTAYDTPEAELRWRALTTANTVPVFVCDDLVLTDSAVILEYLADRFGGVLEGDARQRAQIREMLQRADNPVGRAVREVVFEKRAGPPEGWDRDRIARAEEAWRTCLPKIEAQVHGNFLAGDRFSVADAAMAGRFGLAFAYGLELPPGLPRLAAWWAARTAEPFFYEASPPKVRAFLDEATTR